MNRRQFLKNSTAMATGTAAILSGMAPQFSLASQRGRKELDLTLKSQRKALVFIMLDGGNDSFNMLLPASSAAYRQYQQSRGNLAIPKDELLLLENFTDHQQKTFAIHPAMPEVQSLFQDKKLAFIANIGALVEPVTKSSYKSNQVKLPLGLMSHADQFMHWQTARPGERLNSAWLGFFADNLQKNKDDHQVSMNISLAGHNIMQNGVKASPYAITKTGSVGLSIKEDSEEFDNAVLNSFTKILNQKYTNDPLKQTYLSITREAQAQHENFQLATASVKIETQFSEHELSQQLKKVVQTIVAADNLNLPQQTFFIRYSGWDHHDELLNNHSQMLSILSQALGEFQSAIEEQGVAQQTITFTGSDFGRTLTSNGNGTDHGWGGNSIVMGHDIDGGKVFGEYPELTLGAQNALDVGDGVLIPTTSIDQLYAELALWFGANLQDLDKLFPNLNQFYDNRSGEPPIGTIKHLLPNYLFDWAEQNYPQYFTPNRASTVQASYELDGYILRYYPETSNYLGVKNNHVYVYGKAFSGLKQLGSLKQMLAMSLG